MTIYRGPGGAGDATNDAIVNAVAAYATSAASSADNAANSASAASTSATNASTSATNAASSASQAATSASNSAASASTASTQASTATTQANNAAASATAASNSAAGASTYASNAASSASTATSKAAEAETYAIRAETAETNAETAYANTLGIFGDATDVANAVAAASTSATNAANSATTAASSATAASGSATTAGNYASAALNSANTANAEASEAQSAANTAVAALQSAQAIYNDLDAITAAVDEAEDWATQSANSATASSASSSAAQTSANSAATSATNAANSATQSAASAASAAAIVTGVASNRASIRPSLLLDFSNTKQLDPRITFSRPTTATYYDGKTVVKAEENLFTQSQALNLWTKARASVTSNSTTAPDGTSTASLITEDNTASNSHLISSGASLSFIAGLSYVYSCFVKASTRSWIQLELYSDRGYSCYFDVTNGVLGTAVNATGTITPVGNDWYRCSIAFTSIATTGSTGTFAVYLATGDGGRGYSGNGTSGLYLWGAQVEQRSSITAYTATTGAPITNYIPALQTAAAGVPRFDHDPVTGESKGFLIEEQRTNLLTYSDQFDNAAWAKADTTIVANTIIAPDGTLTSDKVISNTTNTTLHNLLRNQNVTVTPHTLSIYAKAGELSWIRLLAFQSGLFGASAFFNVSSGTIGTVGADAIASITNAGNGWYRCSITYTPVSAASATQYLFIGNSDNFVAYAGNDWNGLYIWGAQLEAGSFPTSYIPTVASQVTRSADSASMTGSNFSSWYRADEGTLYANVIANTSVYSWSPIFIGTSSDYIRILGNNASVYAQMGASGVNNVNIGFDSITNGADQKITLAYKTNYTATALNGSPAFTDTSCVIPSVSSVAFGSSYPINSCIKRIAYYPKRLSNTELQAITS